MQFKLVFVTSIISQAFKINKNSKKSSVLLVKHQCLKVLMHTCSHLPTIVFLKCNIVLINIVLIYWTYHATIYCYFHDITLNNCFYEVAHNMLKCCHAMNIIFVGGGMWFSGTMTLSTSCGHATILCIFMK
jgi:hypothetical protein